MYFRKNAEAEEENLTLLTLWQIDSFEGGKGSRAEYLRSLSENFARENNVYIEVKSVSSDAARKNIANGIIPDIISYGSGFYGIEGLVSSENYCRQWCRGAYCILSLGNSDFSDVTAQNTIINTGRENLASAAALFLGLSGADCESSTGAYVKLINGEYKYLLGTQRDIVRLKTRGVQFSVKPVTIFNDLYQNISVLSEIGYKYTLCNLFIEYIISNSDNLSALGMFYDGLKLYEDELTALENLTFEYTVAPIVSQGAMDKILSAISENDVNVLKSVLK